MTVLFTDEEYEWIDKKEGKWTVKDGCPKKLRNKIQKKLDYIYNFPKWAKRR